jgi:hypothetical protein
MQKSSTSFKLGQFRLSTSLTLLLFTICSCTATISQRDGSYRDTYILRSDAEYLHVQDRDGSESDVRRTDIADIDHPGNVIATLGLVAAAVFLPLAATAHGDAAASCFGIGVGSGILGSGMWLKYYNSKRAANNFTPRRVSPTPKAEALHQKLPAPSSSPGSSQPISPEPGAPNNGSASGGPQKE